METSRASPELFCALAKAQSEIENAAKNAANPHFRSRYADLAEVLNTVRPVLARHGLSVLQATAYDGHLVHVTTVLAHSSGGLVSSTASCEPARSDAQGVGAATTYLRRYALAAMCGVAQEDDDGQSARHDMRPGPAPAAQDSESAALEQALRDASSAKELAAAAKSIAQSSLGDQQRRALRALYARRSRELSAAQSGGSQ